MVTCQLIYFLEAITKCACELKFSNTTIVLVKKEDSKNQYENGRQHYHMIIKYFSKVKISMTPSSPKCDLLVLS